MVGAVVIDAAGHLAGEGYHAEFGGGHAEVFALNAAGTSAHGGTLFVSLEPCNHHGKTPPCTDAILRAGIKRVVFGALDPNPSAGGGAARLQAAGIQVEGPLLEDVVRSQNAVFFHSLEQQSVFVAVKLATTLDGRIAETRGSRTSVTGPEANDETQRLRAGFDAIMVGRGTISIDDPLLTVRGEVMPLKPPLRIVLDSDARLPANSRIVQTSGLGPVWLFCAADADAARRRWLEQQGVRVFVVARARDGVDLDQVLGTLWREGVRSVFCEGGALVAGSLSRADRIDRLYVFIAPRIFGATGVGGFDAFATRPSSSLRLCSTRRFGNDVLITYDRVSALRTAEIARPALESYVHGAG
jgi:diaminohydroxyphosphoribosylaminopyrimidine deaminase/5-amino-6-(5-phosphoribosylamino)uracil reductase